MSLSRSKSEWSGWHGSDLVRIMITNKHRTPQRCTPDLSRAVKVIKGGVVGFVYARDGGGASSALSTHQKFLHTVEVVARLTDAEGVPGGQAVRKRLFSTTTTAREQVVVWKTKYVALIRTGTRLQIVPCNIHDGKDCERVWDAIDTICSRNTRKIRNHTSYDGPSGRSPTSKHSAVLCLHNGSDNTHSRCQRLWFWIAAGVVNNSHG